MALPLVRLGDCCDVVSGATPPTGVAEYWDGDIVWLTPKDIANLSDRVVVDSPDMITRAGFDSCSTQMLPAGSVLVSSRAPIGHVAIAGRTLCTNQGFKSLVPGVGVDSQYLYHCMKYFATRLAALGNGATFKEVSKSVVEDFRIPLPSDLDAQRRIATVLDKADAIRKKRQEAIKLADEFIRSAFLDMFGDPQTNLKGWPTEALGNFAIEGDKINYGVVQPGDDLDDGVPLVRVGDLGMTMSSIASLKKISPEIERNYVRSRLVGDEILIGCVGSIGRLGLASPALKGANVARAVARLRPSNRLPRNFLYAYLSTPFIQNFFKQQTRTVSQPTLNIGLIEETPVIVPPYELAKRFDSLAENIHGLRKKLKAFLEESEYLFDSLSAKAFSGQL